MHEIAWVDASGSDHFHFPLEIQSILEVFIHLLGDHLSSPIAANV